MQEDTNRLLAECDAGIQMAVTAIDAVLPSVHSRDLRRTLAMSREAHQTLHKKTHSLLNEMGAPGKNPGAMARGMNRLHTDVRMLLRPGDGTIADLVVSGCNMGVKNLHRFRNRFAGASPDSRQVADSLIRIEDDLKDTLYPFL